MLVCRVCTFRQDSLRPLLSRKVVDGDSITTTAADANAPVVHLPPAAMIVRQLCARHGRTVLARSSRHWARCYATDSSEPSSLADAAAAAARPPTVTTREISDRLSAAESLVKTLQAEVQAHATARIMALADIAPTLAEKKKTATTTTTTNDTATLKEASAEEPQTTASTSAPNPTPAGRPADIQRNRRRAVAQRQANEGTRVREQYQPAELVTRPTHPDHLTLPLLLAAQTHLGHATSLWNPANAQYITGIRDGIHIISLDITFAFLKRAAKVVREVARRGGIVLFVGTRDHQQDIVVQSAKAAGGYHIFDRWTPGTLTNGQQILGGCAVQAVDRFDRNIKRYNAAFQQGQHSALRPDLVVVLNPLENEACLHECGLYNVPTIGIIDTDANPAWVTYPIPANDDSFRSVALIAGCLGQAGREGQQARRKVADKGRTTYGTKHAEEVLALLEETSQMDVQEQGVGEK